MSQETIVIDGVETQSIKYLITSMKVNIGIDGKLIEIKSMTHLPDGKCEAESVDGDIYELHGLYITAIKYSGLEYVSPIEYITLVSGDNWGWRLKESTG